MMGRGYRILKLMAWFAWELIIANFRVARDVVMPLKRLRPVILAVPLEPSDERLLAVISSGITLTPGSLSLDISPDRRHLYVHAMHAGDVERLRREIAEQYLRRVREALG